VRVRARRVLSDRHHRRLHSVRAKGVEHSRVGGPPPAPPPASLPPMRCRLCRAEGATEAREGLGHRVVCPSCGPFSIGPFIDDSFRAVPARRQALARAVRALNAAGRPPGKLRTAEDVEAALDAAALLGQDTAPP
jgi:hypothetical protein